MTGQKQKKPPMKDKSQTAQKSSKTPINGMDLFIKKKKGSRP
jgi:hypothetical protein